jgi:hypothetical protein
VPLQFSNHALQRMAQRNISREDVESALRRPSGLPRPGDAGKLVKWGFDTFGGILKVVVLATDQSFVVSVMRPDEQR